MRIFGLFRRDRIGTVFLRYLYFCSCYDTHFSIVIMCLVLYDISGLAWLIHSS